MSWAGFRVQPAGSAGGRRWLTFFILIIRGIELLLGTMGKDLGERFWRIG